MLMLTILVIGAASLLVGSLSRSAPQITRDLKTGLALALAREALLDDSVSQTPFTSSGYLRLPDLGFKIGLIPAEGSAAPNFSGNSKDFSVIGKLPWRTLGLEPLRDAQGECLWYAVSGRFKNTPATETLNWDTAGQISVGDAKGNIVAENLAALVIAPNQIVDAQNRTLSDPAYAQCGGNYDARNYLDRHSASARDFDNVSDAANYFSGSINNRVARDAGNKLVVMAGGSHPNDRFVFISVDDIFRALIRRSDFSTQVAALLNDAYFMAVAITGSKGTDSVNCNALGSDNQTFCKNWKEMLLLAQLPVPASVTLDGSATGVCSRVLFFGGEKIASQLRLTGADKLKPSNYLEGINLSAYASPVALAGNFSGTSTFNAKHPAADVLKCLA